MASEIPYSIRHRSRGAWLALLSALALASASSPGLAADGALSPTAFVDALQRAEAATAQKDWPAAARLWEQVSAANPVEGRFWSNLGDARFRSGYYRAAIAAYRRAVELGYGEVANNAYNIACAFARLGEKDEAIAWLERALAERFLDLELLRSDDDLASLRGDPRYERLVPLARDPSGLSRIDGWRHDLTFLAWQIDRLGYAPYRLKPRSWFQERFEALAASADRRTDTQLALELAGILRWLGDGHSGLMGGRTEDWALTLPVQFGAFEDGIFIIAADPAHRDLLGSRLLRYGGRPVEEPMAMLAGSVSRDNDGPWARLQASYRLRHTALLHAAGLNPERGAALLRLRGLDGKEREVRLAADTSQPDIWNAKPNPPSWVNLGQARAGPRPLWLRHPERRYWFEHLPERRTVYFGFNSIRNDPQESLAAFAGRLERFIADNQVDRLVIDLRWNNGGNAQLLTPLLASLLRSERINRRGRLFVLIGRRTFSAAQYAAALLERHTEATFVGEPTGSSPTFIGEEDAFVLPYSKLAANVSHLAWQGGWPQDRRTWIAPLIHVPPTFADYRAGRDAALEAVLALPLPD